VVVKKPSTLLVAAAERLRDELEPLTHRRGAGEAATILVPVAYAWENHRAYLEKWARAGIEALLVGMNPGPWGMGQTGVPFGDPWHVRHFLEIAGTVSRPRNEHARCPILGLASPREEVSGQRLWGGAKRSFGSAERFFERFFVANYCPLLFLAQSGANVTPDKVPKEWMAPVLEVCDEHLRAVVAALEPNRVVGVGAWATKRAQKALEERREPGRTRPAPMIATLLHPSPASPTANRGWFRQARKQLAEIGCPWPAPR
jgi:single-strand selective monofunctional uracil DNA glycosylase